MRPAGWFRVPSEHVGFFFEQLYTGIIIFRLGFDLQVDHHATPRGPAFDNELFEVCNTFGACVSRFIRKEGASTAGFASVY